MSRLSIAWCTSEAPDAGAGGGGIRQSQLLRRLAAAHDVDLLLVKGEPDAVVAGAVRSVRLARAVDGSAPLSPMARRLRTLWQMTGGPHPEVADEAASVTWLRSELAAMPAHDVVVVEHLGVAPLVSARRPGERWLLEAHNLASQKARQQLAVVLGGRQRLAVRGELAKAERLERAAVRDFDTVLTVSTEDAAILGGGIPVVPNGVDLAQFHCPPRGPGAGVLFTGTLDYLANVEGLEWLVGEVWPRVRAARPDATLSVVGRNPHERVRAIVGRDGITLHADVPAVQPHLAAAQVCVVPVRIGSGTRLKALEAFAAERPVVGTAVGLEGLGVVDGQHALVREDAAGTAAAVLTLLSDDDLAARVSTAARTLADSFSWDVVGADFVGLVERTAGRS